MSTHQPRIVPRQAAIPMTSNEDSQLSPHQMLDKARQEGLRNIALRNRAKDQNATTSLNNLDLARRPLTAKQARKRNLVQQPGVDESSSKLSHPTKDQNHPISEAAENLEAGPSTSLSRPGMESPFSGEFQDPASLRWFSSPADTDRTKAGITHDDQSCSIPSNESEASGFTEQQTLRYSNCRGKRTGLSNEPIRGWDGEMQPPPVDWNDRPRFDNHSPEFRNVLRRWNADVVDVAINSGRLGSRPFPPSVIEDVSLHPDGISFVSREFTIDQAQAMSYGYTDIADTTKYCQPLSPGIFSRDCKMDASLPRNLAVKDEKSQDLIDNWNRQIQGQQDTVRVGQLDQSVQPEVIAHSPRSSHGKIKIYLRPALPKDVSQLVEIYNWHIVNGIRPPETNPIDDEEMSRRLEDCILAKLPFLVAVDTSRSGTASYETASTPDHRRFDDRQNDSREPVTKFTPAKEVLLGFTSATDFTAADFIEHISVELEIYVHPAYRQRGIGGSLMDKVLEALDRGYVRAGGVPFHCAQEERHLYSPGGGRDVHKILAVLRKFKYPKKPMEKSSKRLERGPGRNQQADDREDDYDLWLKQWLEKWGFAVEGMLSGIGAKRGRFIDVAYLGRETAWQPAEGRIPQPLAGAF